MPNITVAVVDVLDNQREIAIQQMFKFVQDQREITTQQMTQFAEESQKLAVVALVVLVIIWLSVIPRHDLIPSGNIQYDSLEQQSEKSTQLENTLFIDEHTESSSSNTESMSGDKSLTCTQQWTEEWISIIHIQNTAHWFCVFSSLFRLSWYFDPVLPKICSQGEFSMLDYCCGTVYCFVKFFTA
jgi:hypothetical protein